MYHLFAWDDYENEYGGGMDSYIKSFDTIAELKAYYFPEGDKYPFKTHAQIVVQISGDLINCASLVLLETYKFHPSSTHPLDNKWLPA